MNTTLNEEQQFWENYRRQVIERAKAKHKKRYDLQKAIETGVYDSTHVRAARADVRRAMANYGHTEDAWWTQRSYVP